jgi:hypothetical protein
MKRVVVAVVLIALAGFGIYRLIDTRANIINGDMSAWEITKLLSERSGGDAALERWKVGRLKYQVHVDQPPEAPSMTFEVVDTFHLPGRSRREVTATVDGKPGSMIFICSGSLCWTSVPGREPQLIELPAWRAGIEWPEYVMSFHPGVLYRNREFLAVAGEERIGLTRVVAIRGTAEADRSERLVYIDKKTGLVIGAKGVVPWTIGSAARPMEIELGDYQPSPGGLAPRRFVGWDDGRKVLEMKFTGIELLSETDLDPALFEFPK